MKTNKKSFFLITILILLVSVFTVSCSTKGSVKFNVEFNTYGGTVVDTLSVEDGSLLYAPNEPQKDGYSFGGWYYSNSFNILDKVDFPITINNNTVLHAKWNEEFAYALLSNSDEYAIAGIGTISSSYLIIPAVHNNKKVTKIADNAFSNIDSIANVEFEKVLANSRTVSAFTTNIVEIGNNAFYNCNNLNNIELPNTVTKIGVSAFEKCSAVEKVVIPESVATIESNAFSNCDNLKTVRIANYTDTVVELGNDVFSGTNLEKIYVPQKSVDVYKTDATWSTYGGLLDATTWTVVFDTDGGNIISNATVDDGDVLTQPADPTKTGYRFMGWYESGEEYDFSDSVTSDITLKAEWTKEHTITFDADNSTANTTQIVLDTDRATQPADPTKTGYRFMGWYASGATVAYDFSDAVTSDITLKAEWTKEHTVTFDADNSTANTTQIVLDAGSATQPADPTKTGYRFMGWYESGATVTYNFSDAVTSDITLKAEWTKEHTISFNTYGADSNIANIIVLDGGGLTLPAQPTKTGYRFMDWYLDSGFTNEVPTSYVPTGDITIHVKWTKEHTISFNTYGADSNIANIIVLDGDSFTLPAQPTKAGYRFIGWYSDSGFTTVVSSPCTPTSDMTIHIKWTKEHTVTYQFNGGTVTETSKIVLHEDTISQPATTTKTGLTFSGWYSDSGLTNKITFPYSITSDTTIHAGWYYVVALDNNGGTGDTSVNVMEGTDLAVPTSPTKSGLTFSGWYSDSGLTTKITFPYAITSDTTIYAGWHYVVTFNTNGGSALSSVNVMEDDSLPTPATTTKTKYTFDGWCSDSGLTNKITFPYAITSDTTIYARWLEDYTVTFDYNGGIGTPASVIVIQGNKLSEPTAPTKAGLAFSGWYSDSGLTTKITIFPHDITTDCTIYAGWYYVVTLNNNGGTGDTSVNVMEGNDLTVPTSPTKSGLTFSGWFSDSGLTTKITFPYAITSDTTIYAGWHYVVTFNTNGGSAVSSVNVMESDSLSTPATTTKTKYTFDGWCSDSGLTNKITFPYAITSDTTIYARWLEDYTVTFDYNGGIGTPASVIVIQGNKLSEPTAPTKAGLTFSGWYSDIALTTKITIFPHNITTDCTIYAGWYYVVTLDNNGGTGDTSVNVMEGTDLAVPTSPTKSGLTFSGWYSDSGLTTKITFPYAITSDTTIYAGWHYTVTFNTNGGSAVSSVAVMEGDSLQAAPATPTKTGLTFSGWFSNTALTSAVTFPLAITSDITIYAGWHYTVTFNTNGATVIAPVKVMEGNKLSDPSPEPTKSGYFFGGWYTEGTFDNKVAFPYLVASDITLHVQWIEHLAYTLINSGTAYEVTGIGTVTSLNIVIPDTYLSLPVVSIGTNAFSNKTNILTISMTNNITQIKNNAIYGCTSLTSITLSEGLTTIGSYALYNCNKIQSLTIPNSVIEIASYALSNMTSLQTLSVPFVGEKADASGSLYFYFIFGNSSSRIPTSLKTVNVTNATSIGNNAFYYISTIETVTLADTITNIGTSAFQNCTNLTSVILPSSALKIGDSAFYASGIKNLIIPQTTVSIGNSTFAYSMLESVIFDNTACSIGTSAFASCASLETINFKNSTLSIGNNAFASSGIKNLTLPQTISSMGSSVFAYSKVESVVFDNTTYAIGASAFSNCISLETINFKNSTSSIGNTAFYGVGVKNLTIPQTISSIGNSAFAYSMLESVVFDNTTCAIGSSAFSNCVSLEIVNFKNSTSSIGNNAFYAIGIKNLTLPQTISSIGGSAFASSKVESVIFNNTTCAIGASAFLNCLSLTSIDFKNSTSMIGASTFKGCKSLTSLVIPVTIESIGLGAFSECTVLEEITLGYTGRSLNDTTYTHFLYIFGSASIGNGLNNIYPSLKKVTITSMTAIPSYAFNTCDYIETIVLGEGTETINTYAFSQMPKLKKVVLPSTLKYIKYGVFHSSTLLTEYNLPEGLLEIDGYAFYQTSKVNVVIPSTVQKIADYGFYYATMTTIDFTTAAADIGRSAFQGCSNLVAVDLPTTIKSIGQYAFGHCSSLSYISLPFVGRSASDISSTSSNFYYIFGNTNTHIPESVKTVHLKNSITEIYAASFASNSRVETVIMENSVVKIGNSAFGNCTSLKNINFSSNLLEIGTYAFSSCFSLENITFSSSLVLVNSFAFAYCTALTDVVFQLDVQTFGDSVFQDCSSLVNVDFQGDVGAIGSKAFQNCSSLINVDFQGDVGTIGLTAFQNCSSLVSVDFQGDVGTIGSTAFQNCSSLVNVNFQGDVNTFGDSVFAGCTSLVEIVFPSSVQIIGSTLFTNCTALEKITIPFLGGSYVTRNSGYFGYLFGTTGFISSSFPNVPASLKAVTISNGLTQLPDYAFANIKYVENIILPNSITQIGSYAFYNMPNITTMVLNNNILEMGAGVFESSSIVNVNLPNALTKISDRMFYDCQNIASINIASSAIIEIGNYVFSYSAIGNISGSTPSIDLKKIVKIGDYAFANCDYLLEVELPNHYLGQDQTLGKYVFANSNILKIKYSSTLKYIGESILKDTELQEISLTFTGNVAPSHHATYVGTIYTNFGYIFGFKGYNNQKNKFPSSLTTVNIDMAEVPENAFWWCTSIVTVNLSATTTSIDKYAFAYSANLENINLNNVTFVGENAFLGCNKLNLAILPPATEIPDNYYKNKQNLPANPIPSTIKRIGKGAFANCYGLTTITIPASVEIIDDEAFYKCYNLETIIFESGSKLISIGAKAFYDIEALTLIDLPQSLKTIGESAFYHCTNLSTVTFGASPQLTTIGDKAFGECTLLSSFAMPSSVTSLGELSFTNCVSLPSIKIAKNTTTIGNGAFAFCYSLATITVESGNATFAIQGNSLYKGTVLVRATNATTILASTTSISDYAFSGCDDITTITIPASVSYIGAYAFYECSSLVSVTIPNAVTKINKYAFYNCISLTTVNTHNNITAIEEYAFYNCVRLETIAKPTMLSTIGDYAFYNCVKLPSAWA